MAGDDNGAYGHPKIKTPNIDKLAEDGMRFHQSFLTAINDKKKNTITNKKLSILNF